MPNNVEKLVDDIEKNGVVACVGKPRAINGTLDLLCKIIRLQHEALEDAHIYAHHNNNEIQRGRIYMALKETNRLAGEVIDG